MDKYPAVKKALAAQSPWKSLKALPKSPYKQLRVQGDFPFQDEKLNQMIWDNAVAIFSEGGDSFEEAIGAGAALPPGQYFLLSASFRTRHHLFVLPLLGFGEFEKAVKEFTAKYGDGPKSL